jgi:NitT/TauT family transport system substrate-binding protein
LKCAVAGEIAVLGAPQIVSGRARAATRTVHFSEAVHNPGYIDLYGGRDKGFFTEQAIDLQLSAARGDSQAFAAILGTSADFGWGGSTRCEISREKVDPAWC